MLPQRSLAVVGADHSNKKGPGRRFEIAVCVPGESVKLEREPKNPVDSHAVTVFSARGVQLGYLRAEQAAWIGGMILNGREVITVFQRASQFGCWIRAAFDGDYPSVDGITDAPTEKGEPDWYPDEIYPDD